MALSPFVRRRYADVPFTNAATEPRLVDDPSYTLCSRRTIGEQFFGEPADFAPDSRSIFTYLRQTGAWTFRVDDLCDGQEVKLFG
jgi:hypothetical protein